MRRAELVAGKCRRARSTWTKVERREYDEKIKSLRRFPVAEDSIHNGEDSSVGDCETKMGVDVDV